MYESLTYALTSWAERTLLFLAEHMPEDYILTMAFDRTTGTPVGPRGTILGLLAAISAYDAYNGFIPPSWENGAGSRFNDTTIVNDYNVKFGHYQPGSGNQFHVGLHA